jgi:hypothetical protein
VHVEALNLPDFIRHFGQAAGKLDFRLAAAIQDALGFLESFPVKLLTQLLLCTWVDR